MKRTSTLLGGSAVIAYVLSTGLAAAAVHTAARTASSTVGTPNTGDGGMVAVNLAMLALSALIAAVAALFLARERNA